MMPPDICFDIDVIVYPMRSSQDSSVGNTLVWYSEGPGFKSCRLQLNFQLKKGCGRDFKQYAIKYGCVESNLN